MAEEVIPDARTQRVLDQLGIKSSDSNYRSAQYSAKSLFDQGYSESNVIEQMRAQGYGAPTASTPNKLPGEQRLTINEFGAIANNQPVSTTNDPNLISRIVSQTGLPESNVRDLLDAAAKGNANAMATLAALGVEPYATMAANEAVGIGGGGGGGGSASDPYGDARTRQALALFDPNYPDGALIPLPDGTSRINGTEIIIDSRVKGQFKPVAGADGYLVDPVSGQIIDLNGNQIARSQLEETIRSNKASEAISLGQLDLQGVLGTGRLNLDAATSENEQTLKNILETNGLNLESFLGTGNLNIGATNAETSRLNALTGRTAAAGGIATDLQTLQDTRTQAVIKLMANPQDFVEREYASRALLSPPGYTGPAFKDNPQIQQIIDELLNTPDVGGLLPTYTAPTYQPVDLPNKSLPRVAAPPLPVLPSGAPTGQTYTNTNVAPENQAASTHFRSQGVPDWALAPLGYAYGTDDENYAHGTRDREFITGDPQADGMPNPEITTINNPGPNTTASVTPLRDIMNRQPMQQGREMANNNMGDNSGSNDGLSELIAGILIAVANKWSATGQGTAEYAYGTTPVRPDFSNLGNAVSSISGSTGMGNRLPNEAFGSLTNEISNRGQRGTNYLANTPAGGGTIGQRPEGIPPLATPDRVPLTGQTDTTNTTGGIFSRYLAGRRPTWDITSPTTDTSNIPNVPSNIPQLPWNSGDFSTWFQQLMSRLPQDENTLGINPRVDRGGLSYFAYGTDYNGPRDYAGNPLGTLTSYDDKAIQNMPNVQYAQNVGNRTAYNTLNTGNLKGPFGTTVPDVGGLNYGQLLDIAQDPDSWGTLSSIYRAANRNLEGILARVRARAPIGNVIDRSLIRTGG